MKEILQTALFSRRARSSRNILQEVKRNLWLPYIMPQGVATLAL